MFTAIRHSAQRLPQAAYLRSIRLMASVQASDRGDVPGWVLVSVMTAGLTTAIWLIADDQLTGILDRAMSSVSQP